MLGLIVIIVSLVALFKVTGFLLKICGKIIGGAFSILGYLLLAVLGVSVFGLAMVIIPIILIVGVVSILASAAIAA